MQKRILLTSLITIFLPQLASATIHPVATLSLGGARTNVFSEKNITILLPFQNTYIGASHYDTEDDVGVFVGGEKSFSNNWAMQLGVSYFQPSAFTATGNVYQFGDPAFDNLNYQYQIQTRRVMVETKISRTIHERWRPFFTAGLGASINQLYGYMENPITSDAVPMASPFSSHTHTSFAYMLGVGVDFEMQEHLRIGGAYRFVDAGSASLGTTPLQESSNTLSHTHLHTNEFLAQVSFVG